MMSENEEPPAKVLKIENVDGVKGVTEMSDIPQVDSLEEEMEIMGAESGIISGGADIPEHEDGQEEWLSEGILTDDDYNPGSQDSQDANDQTDSQLGTDDDQLNDSEHLDTTAESEANAESEPNQGLESEGNMLEIEEHLDQMETDSRPNSVESQTYTQEQDLHTYAMEKEANIAESEENVAESEANIAESEANIAESEANIAESEANMLESEANIKMSEANIAKSEANIAKCEANIVQSEANTAESEANGLESEANILESEANILESEANIEKSESNIAESEANMIGSEANIAKSETNILETEANIAESDPNIAESEANTVESNKANGTESLPTILNGQANMNSNVEKPEINSVELNIEETMEHLDGNNPKTDVFDSLLTNKTDTKNESKSVQDDMTMEQDDGNDTDDLLRMLGEDDSKSKKKLTKTVKDIRAAAPGDASSDDDDFVYEGATVKKLKAAKHALAKKQPATKAVPEDMEDGDDESDEEDTLAMMKMFNSRGSPSPRTPNILTRHRAASKSSPTTNVVVKRAPVKTTVNVVEKPTSLRAKSTPLKPYQTKRTPTKSLLKPSASPRAPTRSSAPPKLLQVKKEPGPIKRIATKPGFKPPEVKTPTPFKSFQSSKSVDQKTKLKAKPDEANDEEELLNEDEFDFDEDEYAESDLDRQRIMRPEMMDEEIPSDGESHSDDGSLYDELPSSDSEDMDDWFQLDIRAEKAGDYIPLLGPKAKELLLEEKRRVTARLVTLKQSLTALTESGKKQAERLRDATMALAELDDMLKAS